MGESRGKNKATGGTGPRGRTQATEHRDIDQAAFLAAFAIHGTITAAALAISRNKDIHYRWLREDPEYPDRFRQAQEGFADRLEAEALRRAHDGLDRVRFSAGKIILREDGTPWIEKEFSDTLLLAMLKAHRPDMYKERSSVEHSGAGGGPVKVAPEVSPGFVADVLARLGEAGGQPPAEGSG